MNEKNQNLFAPKRLTEQDYRALVQALNELISGVNHCMDVLRSSESEEESPVLMVAAHPGKPIQIKTVEECFDVLPCFGESDAITTAGDTGLLLSYDQRHIIELDGEKYLIGPAILYAVDEEGEDAPLTARDIYAARLLVEERTVTLCANGKDIPALRLD